MNCAKALALSQGRLVNDNEKMIRKIKFIVAAMAVAGAMCACQNYDTEIDELQKRIDELATDNSKVNDNVAALSKIVEALQESRQATSFSKVVEAGKVVGYTVTFNGSDGSSDAVTVYNSTVNVSVAEDGGKYYWTVSGEYLTDADGNRVEACKEAVVPRFRLKEGTIEASTDGGVSWAAVGYVGTPVLDSVVDGDTQVEFHLAGGTVITIPKMVALSLKLSSTSQKMAAGGGRTVGYTITGGNGQTSVMTWAKDGWTANVIAKDSASGEIEILAPEVAGTSQIIVIVSDNSTATGGRSVFASIDVTSTK